MNAITDNQETPHPITTTTDCNEKHAQLIADQHTIDLGENILIVDDNDDARDMIIDVLKNNQRKFFPAADLAHAKEILLDQAIDLVICDIRLPDGNGVELLEWCNRNSLNIPFILVTGFADTDNVIRALNLGASTLLEKPFDITRLEQAVNRAIAEQRCARIEEQFRAHMQRSNQELRQQVADTVLDYQRFYIGALTALAKTIDARDPYTRQHSASVARLASKTAASMGLSEKEIEAADIAGNLHDIGKLAIPEKILLKPGSLTSEEFAAIKNHPVKSREILADLPNLGPVIDAVYTHHERYDGKGYPRGLSGSEIPVLGRIIAVCDTWNAMTTDRPYRKAMNREKAMTVLYEERGRQLDPQVVELFLENEKGK